MLHVNRRVFLQSLLASSALYGIGCGGSSSGGGTSGNSTFDTAIVGAGMAGLTAANTLLALGQKVIVLEARPRVGGRAVCDNSFAVPADLGAQWFHQGMINPLIPIAESRGVATVPDVFPRVIYRGSSEVPPTDPDAIAMSAQFVAMNGAASLAGIEITLGTIPDRSAGATMEAAGLKGRPWYNYISDFIAGDRGVSMEQLSNLDLFNFTSLTLTPVGVGTGEEILVPSGMGNFVAGLSQGVPIKLSTPVTTIDYSHRTVRLTTSAGTVKARTVIVTIPIPVLATQKVLFNPPLPQSYLGALAGFNSGVFLKIWLEYDRPVFGNAAESTFVSQLEDTLGGGIAAINLYGKNLAVVLALDPVSRQIEAQGTDALIDYGIGLVNKAFPDATADRVTKKNVASWGTDPWALGSWVEAAPGGVPGRVSLATPIDNRVFIASDTLSLGSPSSLAGAYESALATAQLVQLALAGSARALGPDDVVAAYRRLSESGLAG